MEHVERIIAAISKHFERLARTNAVVAKPISVGDRHVVPLCELRVSYGAGGGAGESLSEEAGVQQPQQGKGGGGGGASKAAPVAVLVVENGKVRLQRVGD